MSAAERAKIGDFTAFMGKMMMSTIPYQLMQASLRTHGAGLLPSMEAVDTWASDNTVAGFAATGLGFAIDPTTYLFGGIGKGATIGVSKLGGRLLMPAFARSAGTNAASRALATGIGNNALGGRVAAAATKGAANFVGGGVNFVGFSKGHAIADQLARDGKVNWDSILDAGSTVEEFLTGGAVGMVGQLVGNVGAKIGRGASGLKAALINVGTKTAGIGAEAAVFATPEWIKGEDPLEAYEKNLMMTLGFKISGAITGGVKTGTRFITDGAEIKRQGGIWREMTRRLSTVADPTAGLFTNDEVGELRAAGYGDLEALMHHDTTEGLSKEIIDSKELSMSRAQQVNSYYDRMYAMLKDPKVSETAKAKLYWALTGKPMGLHTVTNVELATDPYGKLVLTYTSGKEFDTSGPDDILVKREKYSNPSKAREAYAAAKHQVELNRLDMDEQRKAAVIARASVDDAIDRMARRYGVEADVMEALIGRDPQLKKAFDEELIAAQEERAIESPDVLRGVISEKYAVDLDKALAKRPDKRSDDEYFAVGEYRRAIQVQARPEMGQGPSVQYRRTGIALPEDRRAEYIMGQRLAQRYFEQEFGDEAAFLHGLTPEQRIHEMELAGESEQRISLAKSHFAYKGIVEGIVAVTDAQARVEAHRAAESERGRERTDTRGGKTGEIQRAAVNTGDGERPVYVISGDVATMLDGAVDKRASSPTIVVEDAESGERVMVAPTDLTSVEPPVDVEDAARAAEDAVYQRRRDELRPEPTDDEIEAYRQSLEHQVDKPDKDTAESHDDTQEPTLGSNPDEPTTKPTDSESTVPKTEGVLGPGAFTLIDGTRGYITSYDQESGEIEYYLASDLQRWREGGGRGTLPFHTAKAGDLIPQIVSYKPDEPENPENNGGVHATAEGESEQQNPGLDASLPAVRDIDGNELAVGDKVELSTGRRGEVIDIYPGVGVGVRYEDGGELIHRNAGITEHGLRRVTGVVEGSGTLEGLELQDADGRQLKPGDVIVNADGAEGTVTGEKYSPSTYAISWTNGEVTGVNSDILQRGGYRVKGEVPSANEATAPSSETEQPAASSLDRIPKDQEGRPLFEQAEDAETAWDGLVEHYAADDFTPEDQEDMAMEHAQRAMAAARKLIADVEKLRQGKDESERDYLMRKKRAQNAAKAALAKWEAIAKVKGQRAAVAEAERQAAAEAAEAERQRQEAERQQAELKEHGAHAVGANVVERWNNARRVRGDTDTYRLADNSKISGHWEVVEAGAATSSHDPDKGYTPSAGYPMDINGNTTNDRDYEHNAANQRETERYASAYNERAMQEAVIVSRDGVVLSGNGRNMAGILAARQGTDTEYVEYLRSKEAAKHGIDPESIKDMEHPRLVFVVDEDLPYTAKTMGRFNKSTMKAQAPQEVAVKMGKVVSDNSYAAILDEVNKYDSLSDLYANGEATAAIMRELGKDGVLDDNQLAGYIEPDGLLTESGKEFLEQVIIGKAFESTPQAVYDLNSVRSMRRNVIKALSEISRNKALGQKWSLESELAEAMRLVVEARTSKKIGEGERASGFAFVGSLDAETQARLEQWQQDPLVLMLADLLNDKKATNLKKILSLYNQKVAETAAGQNLMFAEPIESPEQALRESLTAIDYDIETLDKYREKLAAPGEPGTAEQTATPTEPPAEDKEGTAAGPGDKGGATTTVEDTSAPQPNKAPQAPKEKGRAHLDKDGYRAVVARDEDGQWVLSAFDTKRPAKKKKKGAAAVQTPGQPANAEGAGAVAPNLSEDKGSEKTGNEQEGGAEKSAKPQGGQTPTVEKRYVEQETVDAYTAEFGKEIDATTRSKIINLVDRVLNAGDVQVDDKEAYVDEICAVDCYPSERDFVRSLKDKLGQSKQHGAIWFDKETGTRYDLIVDYPKTKAEPYKITVGRTRYKTVDEGTPKEEQVEPRTDGYTIAPKPYTNKQGKTLDTYLVRFDHDMSKEELSALRAKARAIKGWYDRESKGWMLRSAEDARRFAEEVMDMTPQELEDQKPLSLADLKEAQHPAAPAVADRPLTPAELAEINGKEFTLTYKGFKGYSPDELQSRLLHEQNLLRQYQAELADNPGDRGKQELIARQEGRVDALRGLYESATKPKPAIKRGDVVELNGKGRYKVVRIDGSQAIIESADDPTRPNLRTPIDTLTPHQEKPKEPTAPAAPPKAKKRNKWISDEDAAEFGSLMDDLRRELEGPDIVQEEAVEYGRKPKAKPMNAEVLRKGTIVTYMMMKGGLRRFSDYCEAMVDELGDAIRPHLKSLYAATQNMEEVIEAGWDEEMDDRQTVKAFDVYNFDKPAPASPIETAMHIADEQTSAEDTENLINQLKDQRNERKNQPEAPSLFDPVVMEDKKNGGSPDTQVPDDTHAQPSTEETAQKEQARERFVEEVKGRLGQPMPIKALRDIAKRHGLEATDTELQELTERALVERAREIVGETRDEREAFERIVDLYDHQPTIGRRSSERVRLQQYSTPLPISYCMDRWLNDIDPRSGLESCAGNGMLIFAIDPAIMHVNDLDDVRLANLRRQGFAKVSKQDALRPFRPRRYDIVVGNPPFGPLPAAAFDGYKVAGLEKQIILNQLESMKDSGRGAFIIGGNMRYDKSGRVSGGELPFFNYLYSHFNVADVIDVDGELYAKQGTRFPVRVILINGRKPQADAQAAPLEGDVPKVKTFDQLYKRIDDDILRSQKLPDRLDSGIRGADGQPEPVHRDEPDVARPVTDTAARAGGRPEPVPGGTGHSARRPDDPLDAMATQHRPVGRGDDRQPGQRDNVAPDRVPGTGSAAGGAPGADRPGRGAAADAGRLVGGRREPRLNEDVEAQTRLEMAQRAADKVARRDAVRQSLRDNPDKGTVSYIPQSNVSEIGSVIPSNMAGPIARALENLGDVDETVREALGYESMAQLQNALSAEQIDSVGLAIHQMESGKGFIIGDMTGVGKGRQAAALIRWAVRNGHKPIFITEKAGLFTDFYRDLCDIGSGELRPLIINADREADILTQVNDQQVVKFKAPRGTKKVKAMMRTGQVPDGYDFVVMTYSQLGSDKTGEKMAYIERIAANNILVLDESHNAGGEGKTAVFLQELFSGKRGYGKPKGVTFLSATYAKRPDNMPIYAIMTDLGGADMSSEDLVETIRSGGVPLQEIMSRALAASGQLIRRERDFSGVTIDWVKIGTPEERAEHRRRYDSTIDLFNRIIQFQMLHVAPVVKQMDSEVKAHGKKVAERKGTKKGGVSNEPLFSKTFQVSRQLMFALKAETIGQSIVEQLRRGEKPVVAIDNTMESFANRYLPDGGEEFDEPTIGMSYLSYLDGCLRITVEDAKGNKTPAMIPLDMLSAEGQAEYRRLREAIQQATDGVFASPIDRIKEIVRAAGYDIRELTGRENEIQRTESGRFVKVGRTDKDKNKNAFDFNNGGCHALLLNKSGGTGISLHASSKFADQSQRHLTVAQPQLDINTEVQVRGRTDRTGQVHRSKYTYAICDVPAEGRLMMMLKSKLKSLDANTKSSQKGDMDTDAISDFLNMYGDKIVYDYLIENPDFNEDIYDPLGLTNANGDMAEKASGEPPENCASKVCGYVALLPCEKQEAFYKEIGARYDDLIEQLNATGENKLVITSEPLDAVTKATSIMIEGSAPGVGNEFGEHSVIEECEVNVLRKPMRMAEIRRAQARLTDGVTDPHEYVKKIHDQILAERDAELEKKRQNIAKRIQRDSDRAEAKIRDIYGEGASEAEIRKELALALVDIHAKYERKGKALERAITEQYDLILSAIKRLPFFQTCLVESASAKSGDVTSVRVPGYVMGVKGRTAKTMRVVSATLDGRRKIEQPLKDTFSLPREPRTYREGVLCGLPKVDDWDSAVPTETRTTQYIVTGNLMQAYPQMPAGSRIVNFTDNSGNTRQGIILPFGQGDALKQMMGKSLVNFATQAEAVVGERLTLNSVGNVVTLGWNPRQGRFELLVPKTKKSGGKYFLDEEVLSHTLTGEFQERGGRFVAEIPQQRVAELARLLGRKFHLQCQVDRPAAPAASAREPQAPYGHKKSQPENRQDLTTRSEELLAPTPAGGAKLAKISENLSELSKNYTGTTHKHGALTDFAQALGATGDGVSKYALLTLPNGTTAEIRISNHNANAETFLDHGHTKDNISIVFKSRRTGNKFRGHPEVELTEYVYTTEAMAKDPDLLSGVAESLRRMIETGEYEDLTGKAIVNRSPASSSEVQSPRVRYNPKGHPSLFAESEQPDTPTVSASAATTPQGATVPADFVGGTPRRASAASFLDRPQLDTDPRQASIYRELSAEEKAERSEEIDREHQEVLLEIEEAGSTEQALAEGLSVLGDLWEQMAYMHGETPDDPLTAARMVSIEADCRHIRQQLLQMALADSSLRDELQQIEDEYLGYDYDPDRGHERSIQQYSQTLERVLDFQERARQIAEVDPTNQDAGQALALAQNLEGRIRRFIEDVRFDQGRRDVVAQILGEEIFEPQPDPMQYERGEVWQPGRQVTEGDIADVEWWAYRQTNDLAKKYRSGDGSRLELLSDREKGEKVAKEVIKLKQRRIRLLKGVDATAEARAELDEEIKRQREDIAIIRRWMREGDARGRDTRVSPLLSVSFRLLDIDPFENPDSKVVTTYKWFRVKDGELYPAMIDNPSGAGTPRGVAIGADTAQPIRNPDGTLRTNSRGRISVKPRRLEKLAWRPDQHGDDHVGGEQFLVKNPETGERELLAEDMVLVECQMDMTRDYTLAALEFGTNEHGVLNYSQAGVPYITHGGGYRYRTNANPEVGTMTLSHAVKLKRVLDDQDYRELCSQLGIQPRARRGGDIDLAAYGLQRGEQSPYIPKGYDRQGVDVSEEVRQLPGYRRNPIDFDHPSVRKYFEVISRDASGRVDRERAQQLLEHYRALYEATDAKVFAEHGVNLHDDLFDINGRVEDPISKKVEEGVKRYNEMIDAIFADGPSARKKYNGDYFVISDMPDILRGCGFADGIFEVPFKSVKAHLGKADHLNTPEEWKKLPTALSRPFIVTRYGKDGLRIYSYVTTEKGKNIVVGVDVKRINRGKNVPLLEINSIKTVFENNGIVSANEEIVGYDKNITPKEQALLKGLDYQAYPTLQELSEGKGTKFLPEKQGSLRENASDAEGNGIHSYEVTKVEILDESRTADQAARGSALADHARQVADRLNPETQVLDEGQVEQTAMWQRAQTVLDDASASAEAKEQARKLQEQMRRAKGWYDQETGQVVVIPSRHRDAEDVTATVLHENVAHKGLRDIVGSDRYDAFCIDVYNHLTKELRARVRRNISKTGWDIPRAVDELFGELAEKPFTEFTTGERTLWQKIKAAVLDAINRLLGGKGLPRWVSLSDQELRYMLWRSHERMRSEANRKSGASLDASPVRGPRSSPGADLDARFRNPDETEQALLDDSMGMYERIAEAALRLSGHVKDDMRLRADAIAAIGDSLKDMMHEMRNRSGRTSKFKGADARVDAGLRGTASEQRRYDRTTVKRVADLAKVLMRGGWLRDLNDTEIRRLLSAVSSSAGQDDIAPQIDRIMDTMVDSHLRQGRDILEQMMATRGTKVNAQGVVTQGQLDPAGAESLSAFKHAYRLDEQAINDRITELQDRLSDPELAIAESAANQLVGLDLALQYAQQIRASEADEATLRAELRDAAEEHKAGRLDNDAYRQLCESLTEGIRRSKVDRAEAFAELAGRTASLIQGSGDRAKAWREGERQRVNDIHHLANSDMQGRSAAMHRRDKASDRTLNALTSTVLSPLGTFDQALRIFGSKSANGEGYLWNHYMRGWVRSREKEITGVRSKFADLDAKAAEVGGKPGMTWSKLMQQVAAKEADIAVTFRDGGEMVEHEMTQGNLMYIYMVDKMLDGQMKLRKMGIDEAAVDAVTDALDPRLRQLADWLQDEYLPQARNEYNETHKRMFGASMAAVEHYFPLRIRQDSRTVEESVDKGDTIETGAGATVTGAIKKRVRNTLDLDLTNTDAMAVVLDHIAEMEHWNAYAEWGRDLNTLLSYTRFRNQVKNIKSPMLGTGDRAWSNFKDLCRIAAGTYHQKTNDFDATALAVARGATAAKVSFRLNTALKQLLSLPAYIPDVSARDLLGYIRNPENPWRWCMDNLPVFRERWASRIAGDPRLQKTGGGWNDWRQNFAQRAARLGMTPNAFIDAVTVSVGAYAMYRARKRRYLRDGYTEAQAEQRAKEDATILFNQSQQSSEGAFLSRVQANKDWLSTVFTVFRNSPMSYTRQVYDACRNLAKQTPESRRQMVEYMAKQYRRDGIADAQAEAAARRKVNRQAWRDVLRVATYGFILPTVWSMGGYWLYYLLGDDQDEKQKMADDVTARIASAPFEGLAGGDVLSNMTAATINGSWNANTLSKDMPVTGDISQIVSKVVGGKNAEALNDIVNLAVQMGFGVNPQTLEDALIGIMDSCAYDTDLAHETAIWMAYVLNNPNSQIKKLYFDDVNLSGEQASRLTPKELAERYARMQVKRGRGLKFAWLWDDDEAVERETQSAKKQIRARARGGDSHDAYKPAAGGSVSEAYDRYHDIYTDVDKSLRRMRQASKDGSIELARQIYDDMLQRPVDYRIHETYSQGDAQLDKLVDAYMLATTPERAAEIQRMIRECQEHIVQVLDSIDANRPK